MLRRSHKKSKTGCLECKRRHIKCDEHHPICVNCFTATIDCSFTPPAQSMKAPHGSPSNTVTALSATTTEGSSPSSIHPTPMQRESYVNAMHVELFYWVLEGGDWAFGDDQQKVARPNVLRYAFNYQFLLNELLAVSALNLSIHRPAQESLYREEATRLQSQALRLFNETVQDLNSENIIPAFIFSGLQGIATFFETFHDPIYEASDWTLFEKIVQSIRLLQGVRGIIGDSWNFLITSEIKDFLEEAAKPDLEWKDEVVDQFQAFRGFISQSKSLDLTQTTVCDKAMEELITMYKSAFSNEAESLRHEQSAGQHAKRWLIVVPPAYTDLLIQRKPEALAILGHYAIMLHRLRACWHIGDAGKKLLSVIEVHLEEPWRTILAWPKSFVENN